MEWINNGNDENWEDEIDWKPDGTKVEELVGKLVGKRTVNTKNGPVVVLKVEKDGQVYNVWGSRTGLKTLIAEYDEVLTVGTEIGLRCKEKVTLKSGNTFVPYEIGFGEGVPAHVAKVPVDDEPF